MMTRIKLFLCEQIMKMIDVTQNPLDLIKVIGKRVWLNTDTVRQVGEHSGQVCKRNKTGPKKSKMHATSKMAVILLKKI